MVTYPLTRGSGVKVKTLEAIASGVPIVTTGFGAEGVQANDGLIVAETDASIAEATVSLLNDATERIRRGSAAREGFLRGHAPVSAVEPLVDTYRRLANRRA